MVDISWNLEVPKEDIDPNDNLNYVISYGGITDKLTPTYMRSRNPLEGYHNYEFVGLKVFLAYDTRIYPSSGLSDFSEGVSYVLGYFTRDFSNEKSFSIKNNSSTA